ncbi:recombinase family protein, partial [Clostridioides difficile]
MGESKVYGYARVSTQEQSFDRQIQALEKYGVNSRDIVMEKQSGKDFNRPLYQNLKENMLRAGDTLVVKELDRLGRDMEMIKSEWQYLIDKGVNIIILDTPILNTSNKTNLEKSLISNIVFELLSYMAEKERLKIRQRQMEGIKALR